MPRELIISRLGRFPYHDLRCRRSPGNHLLPNTMSFGAEGCASIEVILQGLSSASASCRRSMCGDGTQSSIRGLLLHYERRSPKKAPGWMMTRFH
jgi:hypothetical protein